LQVKCINNVKEFWARELAKVTAIQSHVSFSSFSRRSLVSLEEFSPYPDPWKITSEPEVQNMQRILTIRLRPAASLGEDRRYVPVDRDSVLPALARTSVSIGLQGSWAEIGVFASSIYSK
jgi:hypothetical protein